MYLRMYVCYVRMCLCWYVLYTWFVSMLCRYASMVFNVCMYIWYVRNVCYVCVKGMCVCMCVMYASMYVCKICMYGVVWYGMYVCMYLI